MENIHHITQSLFDYITGEIIPRYDNFDAGHRRDHATAVIDASMSLAACYDVSRDMVFAIAAFHDTGLCRGRALHHIHSAEIVRSDKRLREWFTPAEIETIAEAVCDHRASNTGEPRSIYGKIVAEADRIIIPDTILRRTIQYGLSNYPTLSPAEQIARAEAHIIEKYGENGYLRLWIPESPNAARLAELRSLIADTPRLRECLKHILAEETARQNQ